MQKVEFLPSVTAMDFGKITILKRWQHPKPGKTILIPNNKELITLEVLNINGQVMKTETFYGNQTQLDLQDFENGMYFCKLQTANRASNNTRITLMK